MVEYCVIGLGIFGRSVALGLADQEQSVLGIDADQDEVDRVASELDTVVCADATDEEVRDAARRAHVLEFTDRFPDGLDTVIGERGVKLSGGQRQRVMIAMALACDVSEYDQVKAAIAAASDRFGGVEVLINQIQRRVYKPVHRMLETQLIVRESTTFAPAPSRNKKVFEIPPVEPHRSKLKLKRM